MTTTAETIPSDSAMDSAPIATPLTATNVTLNPAQVTAVRKRSTEYRRAKYLVAEKHPFGYLLIGDTYMKLAKHRDLRTRFKAEGAEWKAEWLAWLWKGDHLPHYMEELIDIHRDVEGDGFMDADNIASDEIEGDKGEMDADKGKNPLQDPTQPPTSPIPSWFVPPSWWGFIDVYVQHRPAIAVVGPAGNGKTTTVEIALQAHNIPFLALSCTSATEVVDLVGGRILTSEGEEWQDGIVTRAFREGKAVVLDEADTLDPRVMMALQNALQDAGPDGKARFVNTPDGRVYPTALCPIILCMNTTGGGANRAYTGRARLDAASLDRLTYIQTDYENEVEILQAQGYRKKTAQTIVKWAQSTRAKIHDAGMTLTLSPRTLLRIAQAVETFEWAYPLAYEMEFFNRVDKDMVEYLK
jgi:hypothetical protein